MAVYAYGSGGASRRAGAPNIITPISPNDQPAWAEQVAQLGVGLRLPGIKQLTAEKLAEAMQTAVTDSAPRRWAARSAPKTAWCGRSRSSSAMEPEFKAVRAGERVEALAGLAEPG